MEYKECQQHQKKLICMTVVLLILIGLAIGIPSLAKLKNRNTIYNVSSWDGSIATSYRKGDGSKENPYIISSGSELAFFIKQLESTDYFDKYFELSNDIVINSGIFEYSEDTGVKYILDGETYYVDETTNEYFDNPSKVGTSIGKINSLSKIENFKGNLNGKSFTIFGLYISSINSDNVAIFENLEGNINDIYISNTMIYGSGHVAGIAVNANNSTISNVLYDGYVVNKSLHKTIETIIEPITMTAMNAETSTMIVLPNLDINSSIKSIKLVGEYENTNVEANNSVKINGVDIANNVFELDLTSNSLMEIPLVVSSSIEGTELTFKNMKYIIEYYDDVTSGLIVNSSNNIIKNTINKADIFGNYISSGFVGVSKENLVISQSYNNGTIKSNYISSGFVGIIEENEKETEIINVYNNSEIISQTSASIIAISKNNTGAITIENTINTSNNYAINTSVNSLIKINNSYSTNGLSIFNGTLDGSFTPTQLENFYNKEFMMNNKYNPFISISDVHTNELNVWIYEDNSMPILYIDDLNNPIANININKYSWNNLSPELNMIDITNNITLSIDDVSAVNPVKEKYYYITNSRVPMTLEELNSIQSWIEYEVPVVIEESGYYVVYAKILDKNNNVSYINTDIMVLNVSGFKSSISINDKEWSTFKNDLSEIYFNENINITISAHDDLLTINSIEYYIADKELTSQELDELQTWNQYINNITITETGKYIIYAKIIDSDLNVRYINTDYLLYGGYIEQVNLGNSGNNYDTNYITNKSSIKLTFESDFEINFKEGYTHNLVTSTLLPEGTKITLIDKSTNIIYQKIIDSSEDLYGYKNSCDSKSNCSKHATYSFNLFKEIGTTKNKFYDESVNYNKIMTNEKYIIIVDFKNTNLVDNYYDMSFYLVIKSNDNQKLYETLNETISNINIYSKINESEIVTHHNLTSDYDNQTIYYNSNSELGINFNNIINYSEINNKYIIDTNYDSKKAGIIVKLFDDQGSQISSQYLDNILFEVGGKEFFASGDNSIKINLGSVTDASKKTLKIKTKENSSGLENGTYFIKINKFISDDGYNYSSIYEDEIVITLIVENQETVIPNYSFDVVMANDSIVLDKNLTSHVVSFSPVFYGEFIEPNIRISLYKKDDLTAYNQKYTMVNIAEYSTDNLVSVETNKYFVDPTSTIFKLNIMPNKFDNTGYKYVFELYDGTRKISKIEKYFIVK